MLAPEVGGGDHRAAGTWLLQPPFPSREDDRGMETCHRPLVTITKFKIETVASVLGSIRRGDWMFSVDL